MLVVISGSLLCLIFIVLAGTNVLERALTVTDSEVVSDLNGRRIAWIGTCNMIADHKFTGTGPSTFSVMFTQYQPAGSASARFYYAHNDYLQYIAELGLPIIIFMVWICYTIFFCGMQKLKSYSRQKRGITLGALTGIVALLIHSFVDFNLHIPSNALLFIMLVALVMGNLEEPRRT